MEEKTKKYLGVGLGVAAYYLFAKDQFKPIKGSDRFFISPAFDRSGSPMMRVLSALLVYKSLRALGVSEESATTRIAVGAFAIEWYLRAYTTKLVAVPKAALPSAAVSVPVEPAAAAPVATGWESWRHEEWREPWRHEHHWW